MSDTHVHTDALRAQGLSEHTINQARSMNITGSDLLDWINRFGPTAVQLITEIVNKLHGSPVITTPP